jgi:hypothetical protein
MLRLNQGLRVEIKTFFEPVCVFLSLFQFVCLVAVSLFFGEISCPGDFLKTPCDKHKGSFWGK